MKKYIKISLISIICILSTLLLFQKIALAGNYDGSVKYRYNKDKQDESLLHLKGKAVGKTIGFTQSTYNPNKELLGQFDPNDHMYCVKHNENSEDGKYTIDGYIRIEGNKATGYYIQRGTNNLIKKEKTDSSNLAMAYILHAEDYEKYYFHNGVRNMAVHHYYSNSWFSKVANPISLYEDGWSTSYNIDWSTNGQSDKNKAWDLVNNATDYAKNLTDNAYPEIKATNSKVEYKANYLGPFNVTYTGKIESITALDASGNAVSGIKVRQSKKDVKDVSKIASGSNFYITSKTNIRKVRVKLKKNTVYIANIWFIQKSYKTAQQLITVHDGEKDVDAETYIEVEEPKGSLTINKKDSDGETKLRAGFKIKNSSGKWLAGTNGAFSFVNYAENAGTYYTDSNTGSIKLNNLPYDSYTVCEVAAPSGYELKYQVGYTYNSNWTNNKKTNWERVVAKYSKDSTAVPINDENIDNSINIINIRKGSLTIFKKDVESSKPVTHIKGAGFKIKTSVGTDTWLSGTKETSTTHYNYSASFKDATTYYIKDNLYKDDESIKRGYSEDNGEYVKIEGLDKGTYHIYEVEPPTGYLLKHQGGFEEVTIDNTKYERVNTKQVRTIPTYNSTTRSNQYNQYIGIGNLKKISISGRVWEEDIPDKGSYKDYDSLYNSNIDHNLGGITVKLIKKGETRATGTTTTNSDGTYLFDSLIKKSELKDYYVEFDYSSKNSGNTRYIPVEFNKNKTNGSKALAYTIPTNDMDVTGIATTYAGTNTNQIATYGLENIGTLNSSTLTLGNINLGIKPLLDPDYGLRQNLAYLKLNIKGYTYIYQYGGTQDADNFVPIGQNGPTAKWQNSDSIYGYSRQFYPSDIIYDRESSKQELEATVVYRIDVTNTVGENTKELYQQPDTLHLISVENRYDTNRYTLISDEIWEDKNNSGTAIMNSTAINKMNNGTAGIASENTSTEYIQFRVKKDAITKILENPRGIIEEFPTTVKTSAYHNYYRDDYMWQNLGKTGTNISGVKSTNNLHRTRNREKEEKAPYLVFSIDEQRTISGKVFKDKIVTNNGEKLGNGIYDSDEKGVEGVKVELLDIGGEKLTLSHLYQAKVIEEENKTITEIKDAVVTTNDRGEYSLEGVVPGRYYLGFIYGNGNYKITKLNGEVVEEGKLSTKIEGKEVTAKEYKSTIIKSKIVKDVIGFVEKTIASMTEEQRQAYEKQLIEDTYTWYKKDEFIQGKYSVAIDDLKVRKELNESKENLNAQALSPQISITIENTKDNNAQEKVISNDSNETVKNASGTESNVGILNDKKENVKNKFEGFYFGIIEQPRQEAEIEKVITNVKLTNAQGNVLYDGNPENVPSQGMVSISDLDNTENGGSTYVRAEIIEDSIYGSNLELTYEVRVKNISDINYYNEDYYKYGDKNPNKEVTLTPANVSDYLDKTLKYDENKSDALRIKEENPNQLETITVNTKNIEAQQFNLEGWKTLYTNQNKEREDETTKDKVVLVANRKLSKDNDDMEITSRAEIKEIVHTPDPADTETSNEEKTEQIKVAPKEVHTNGMVKATMTITPPTGAFANDTILYATVGIISLILLSAGIVIIKKKIV